MPEMNFKVISLLTVFLITSANCALVDQFDLDFVLKGLQDDNSNTTCITHVREYLKSLTTGKQWALKMYDSSANKLYGKFMRQNAYINGYEECLSDENLPTDFTTHYCVLDLRLYAGDNETVINMKPGFEIGFEVSKFQPVKFGVCLPSTCSSEEIKTALKNYLNRIIKNDPSYINLEEESCTNKKAPPLKGKDWAAIGVILFLGLASIASTSYDVAQKYFKNNKPHPLLKSFSIYSNYKIFSKNDSRLKVLDGMRALSCIWIVFFHSGAAPFFGPVHNFKSLFLLSKDLLYVPIQNGTLAVDSFFFLSGFLLAHNFFKSITDKGFYDIPRNYIHRYLRLTPSFAVLILILGTIFPRLADGPFWKGDAEVLSDSCSGYWWRLLSYTQNYEVSSMKCLGQCWYLSADMQLFWMSPLLLFPLYYRPSLAPYLLTIPTLMFTFTSFGVSYAYDFSPSLMSLTSLRFEKEYLPTHTRGAPWMIGLSLGYIFHRINSKNIVIKLSKLKLILGWSISMILCSASYNGIIYFMYTNATTFQSAFYIAFVKVAWALGLAWIVFACEHGYGGFATAFLSWEKFRLLSKLSYGVYLMHVVIIEFRVLSVRTPMWIGDREGTYFFISNIVLSLITSFVLLLYIDIPFANIDRYMFGNVKILPLPKRSGKIVDKRKQISSEKQLHELSTSNYKHNGKTENKKQKKQQTENGCS